MGDQADSVVKAAVHLTAGALACPLHLARQIHIFRPVVVVRLVKASLAERRTPMPAEVVPQVDGPLPHLHPTHTRTLVGGHQEAGHPPSHRIHTLAVVAGHLPGPASVPLLLSILAAGVHLHLRTKGVPPRLRPG